MHPQSLPAPVILTIKQWLPTQLTPLLCSPLMGMKTPSSTSQPLTKAVLKLPQWMNHLGLSLVVRLDTIHRHYHPHESTSQSKCIC